MTHKKPHRAPSRHVRLCATILTAALLSGLYVCASYAQDVGDAVSVYDKNLSNQLGGSTTPGSGNTDTVNGHLKNIDTVGNGNAPASSSSAVAAPKVALVDMSNPDTSQCSSVASAQQQNCADIINTKNSQYQYMKAMYDMTSSRENDLKNLISARQSLQSEDYGKLEDNTNKIMALIAQMAIDRQQMESANNAYNLRISYLQSQQTQAAQAAATGNSSNSILPNSISQIVSGAILKTALSVQQTNNGAQTLNIEGSNGF